MACPRCGTDCHCTPASTPTDAHVAVLIDPERYDPSEEMFSATLSAQSKTEAVPPAAAETQFYRGADAEPQWRNEVTARVSNFRSRRRLPAASAHASMRFDFDARDAAPAVSPAELKALPRLEPEVAKIIAFPKAASDLPATVVESVPAEPRIVEAHAEIPLEELGNEIEIAAEPEPIVKAEAGALAHFIERLADPVVDESADQVLEADPELALPMVQPLADIALDAAPANVAEPLPNPLDEEVALSLAPVFDRAIAGLIDAAVANAAALLFMAAFTLMGKPELGTVALIGVSAVAGVFTWTLYQYLFLVHRTQTLGMQFAELEVRTFKGEPAWRTERRRRVWGLALSCASMGLGFLWTLIDEDRLGWHDRITQTCLVRKAQD